MDPKRISAAWFSQEVESMAKADQGRTWGGMTFIFSIPALFFTKSESFDLILVFFVLSGLWASWGFISHGAHKQKARQIYNSLAAEGMAVKEGGVFGDPYVIVSLDSVTTQDKRDIELMLR